jgi:eukaryotic-like serine/threonine-protein kinase
MQVGRYAIEGELGGGVLRGRDATLGRDIAIQLVGDAPDRERVVRDAQAMAGLAHPNVVTVHELGEASGTTYIAMELVDGERLPAWLASAPRSAAERAAVALGIGHGLAAAHAAGVIHGAVAAEHVVVRRDGVPVVVEFGLVRSDAAAADQAGWWALVDLLLEPSPRRTFPTMAAAVAALERALAPRRRRWVIAAIAAAVVAAGGAAAFALWPRGDAKLATCAPVPPPEWSPARAGRLADKLRAAGIDPARVIAALDARAATTADLRARVCRDAEASARVAVCVDDLWSKTGVAIGRLEDRAEPARLRETIDGLTELMPAERCGRGSLPALPPLRSPDEKARYDALAKRIRGIERDSRAAPAERLARLRAIAPEVEAAHEAALESTLHYAIAHALGDAHDYPAAVAEFERSGRAALAAGDDARLARGLAMALQLVPPSAATARLETEATAAAQRLGNPAVDAELLRARAYVQQLGDNHAAARALYESADAIYTRISLGPHPMHVNLLQNLAGVCLDTGDGAAAGRYYDRAVELARARFGETSPSYWEARGARASSLVQRKEYAAAETELRAVADGFTKYVPSAGELGMVETYSCMALLEQDRLADARIACAAARADLEARLGPDSPGLVDALTMSGRVEQRAHAPRQAVAFLRRAVALAGSGQVRPVEANLAKVYLALALRDAGQLAAARAVAAEVAPAVAGRDLADVRAEFERAFPEK